MAKYRPIKLVLSPYTLRIKYSLNNGNLGEYDGTTMSIEMKRGLSDQQAKSTIIHECIHHTLEPMTFLTGNQEESICRIMERMILSLIKENPKFIKWIQEQDQP